MRPLLALDLSLTSTGVAWRTADGTIDSRVIRTEPGDNPSGYRFRRDGSVVWVGDENYRMRAIAVQIGGEAVGCAVFAESVPTRNARSIVTLAKLHGHVAHALAFDPTYVDPSTVKKHITGHGDANKREVATAVAERFAEALIFGPHSGQRTYTEDEIDALAVLAWAIDQEEG